MDRLYLRSISLSEPLQEDSYLNDIPAIRFLETNDLEFKKPVTIFIGENGSGKSTLIEGIAVAMGFNPEGGTKNFAFSTEDSHSKLHSYLNTARQSHPRDGFFLRAESFYNVASYIDQSDREPSFGNKLIDSYGGVSLHQQSHGESFLALVKNRFSGNGLYILDEPEAALSPARLMQLLCLIHELIEENSQFIIATHSPILMSYPDACIYELNEQGISETTYRETEHYRITKDFIDKPEIMYRHLFDD
ncbi:MAG: AAA family ATPase [Erysipelotrichaceae bacterium]|nr:AAA family ATPase [Erysipelotrichaceae bacterium]